MTKFPIPATHLRQEYEQHKALFDNQPPIVQRFIESQARHLAEALISENVQVRFTLPDRVVLHVKQVGQAAPIHHPGNSTGTKIGWAPLSPFAA